MPFVKVQKNKAYFSRYQVKFRRRREGRTDYRARQRLCAQDKNKYNSPKYRLVVRFTNRQVICQVASAHLQGDRVLAQATSMELPRYGLRVGLKNYPAAYATGLLVARRLLTKLGMASMYAGNEEVTGEIETSEMNGRTFYVADLDDERRPFRAFLDVGICDTTTGARVFGALKGAVDGGLDVPHSEKRFPGYDEETKSYAPEAHRDRIFGEHIAEYMRHLEGEDPERFQAQFAEYIKNGVGPDDLEELYTQVHAKIREDPTHQPSSFSAIDKSFKRKAKDSYEERKARVAERKAQLKAEAEAEDDEDEDDEEEDDDEDA